MGFTAARHAGAALMLPCLLMRPRHQPGSTAQVRNSILKSCVITRPPEGSVSSETRWQGRVSVSFRSSAIRQLTDPADTRPISARKIDNEPRVAAAWYDLDDCPLFERRRRIHQTPAGLRHHSGGSTTPFILSLTIITVRVNHTLVAAWQGSFSKAGTFGRRARIHRQPGSREFGKADRRLIVELPLSRH
jgi:hypothetical protein